MRYSIGDVAEKMNLSTSTLRFYDRKGLLPFVDRDNAGRRSFKDNDLNFLQVIECMKKCGMTINEIRHFIDLCMQGDVTLMDRYDLLEKEAATVKEQIKTLQEQLDFLYYKMWYFKTSIEAQSEEVHMIKTSEGKRVDPTIHAQYREALKNCHNLSELIMIERDGRKQVLPDKKKYK